MDMAELITAIATVGAAVAAWEALKTWKRQLQGSKSHEIAWKYLEAVFKLRNAINYGVRNPWIDWSEFQQASEEHYGKDNVETAKKKNPQAETFAVYAVRWRQINEARKEFRDAKVQAEIWWGNKLPNFEKALYELVGQLYVTVKRVMEPEREMPPDHDTLYYAQGVETEFDSKLDKAVQDVDDWMRPHIRYEHDEKRNNNGSLLIPKGSTEARPAFVPEIFQKPPSD